MRPDMRSSSSKGTLPPGVVMPLRSHAELRPSKIYVLEGSLEAYRERGPSQGWSTTQPAGVLAIPGKVKHALRNISSTPTTVILVTQEELYNFFRSVAKPFEAGQMPDLRRLRTLSSSSLQPPNITTGWARPKRTQKLGSLLASRMLISL